MGQESGVNSSGKFIRVPNRVPTTSVILLGTAVHLIVL